MNPTSVVKLVEQEKPKSLMQKIGDFLSKPSAYLVRQAEFRRAEKEAEAERAAHSFSDEVNNLVDRTIEAMKAKQKAALEYTGGMGKIPTADPTPIPLAYGKVIADGGFTITRPIGAEHSTFSTWRGQPLTNTQYWFDAAPMQWRPRRSATLPLLCAEYDDLVCDKFTVVEWNDMSEFNRLQAIGEWQKVKGLAAHGITMSPADVAAERELQRQEAERKAKELAFQMENHKRKLEKELAEAEEREQHYQQNEIFGAF